MSTVNLNYDPGFDVLYARYQDYSPSYGDEADGIVTYYSIDTDTITGMAIYKAKQRIQQGSVNMSMLPIPIDLNSLALQTLLNEPKKTNFTCTLQVI